MRILLAFVAAALLSQIASAQRTIRVPGEAPTIQAGLNLAKSGDTVLLADGVYRGPGNKSLTMRAIDITVRSEGGAAACIIDMEADGRAMHFYQGQTAAYVVEGITFRNGRQPDKGGAIWIRGASPTLRDCLFENCWSLLGGAIHVENAAAPSITGCVFLRNGSRHDDAHGGAIYIDDAAPALVACHFAENVTSEDNWYRGAAIFAIGDQHEIETRVRLERCRFERHLSSATGYSTISSLGLYAQLIAEHCVVSDASMAFVASQDFTVSGSSFERCDRVLSTIEHAYIDSVLDGCEFVENKEIVNDWQMFQGAFVDCLFTGRFGNVKGRFNHCRFTSASGRVSGNVWNSTVRDSAVTITGSAYNCLIYRNQITAFGNIVAANCTIYGGAGNPSVAQARGGVFHDRWGSHLWGGHVKLVNCVVEENQLPLMRLRDYSFEGETAGSEATIAHSIIPTGTAGIELEPFSTLEFGAGNLIVHPRFVDAASGDLRLAPGSPGIDAGDNTASGASVDDLDLSGSPRFHDDPGALDIGLPDPARPELPIIDIGAYEFQGESPCRADLDGDGELTFFDFMVFQDLFAAGDVRADFDFDGELTFFDYLAFQEAFAAGCP